MANGKIQRPGAYGALNQSDELAKAALMEDDAPENTEAEKDIEDGAKKSPMERWREAISAAELSEEEADKILDSVLSTGHYEKSYKIFRGKLAVTLRSRDSASLQRVSDALDSVRTNDVRVHTQTMNRYNLAASLVRYQDRQFKHPPSTGDLTDRDRAFAERLAFVDSIPAPILLQLYALLSKFDNAVFASLSEGAELGF
jgi:hypothetical protein